MVKVFYHNDPDGWCSAYWVRKHLDDTGVLYTSSDFIEMNYDKPFSCEMYNIRPSEQVFMVDFSLNPELMVQLAANCDFTWIDHHKTAIDKMELFIDKYKFKGFRQDDIAACMLTWAYFEFKWYCDTPEGIGQPKIGNHVVNQAPLFTQYIHLWDTWQWKNHPKANDIESFIIGLNIEDNHPCSNIWVKLSSMSIYNDDYDILGEYHTRNVAMNGHYMIQFRNGYAKTLCESIGGLVWFEGYDCFACNMPKSNSEWFKSVSNNTYDILMPYYYNLQTGKYIFSLYTSDPEIDVSLIAKKYGGGGHRGAAGFQVDELSEIFE